MQYHKVVVFLKFYTTAVCYGDTTLAVMVKLR